MKFALAAASLLASVHSQTQAPTSASTSAPTSPPTGPQLDAKCLLENSIEKLVIEIPYPEAQKANILYLEAGSCDATTYISSGGNMTTSDNNMVTISIPIDACDIRGVVYQTPTVARSYGLIKPTATVTFGQNIGGMDVIFRKLPIAAECGTRTSYTVKFDYKDVTQVDADGCTIVDDVCVFPAYGEEAKFVIKEYTNSDFDVEVDDTNIDDTDNRASVAGEEIFLSMQVTDMPADLKFAVTECKVTDGARSLILMNPGADVSASPSCKIDEIGLSGTYDGFEKFNFQHILFLLDASLDANTFTLECTVEVCGRNDPSSLCNQAAAVCMNDSIDVTDATAVTEKDEKKQRYMCDSFDSACTGVHEVCIIENEAPKCHEVFTAAQVQYQSERLHELVKNYRWETTQDFDMVGIQNALDNGADVNYVNPSSGWCTLMAAAGGGSNGVHEHDNYAWSDFGSALGFLQWPVLKTNRQVAAVLDLLLSQPGINTRHHGKFRQFVSHIGANTGSYDVMEVLVKHGVSMDDGQNRGQNAWNYACRKARADGNGGPHPGAYKLLTEKFPGRYTNWDCQPSTATDRMIITGDERSTWKAVKVYPPYN